MGLVFDISICGADRIRICHRQNLWARAAGHSGPVLAQSSFVDPRQQRGTNSDDAQLYGRQCSARAAIGADYLVEKANRRRDCLQAGWQRFSLCGGLVRLGLTAGSPQAFAARNEHWAIISIQLILFIAGGISVLALAIADYRRERDADSLFLLLWVAGTFWFTAYLNWTVNARSILPMVPAVGILLARRLEKHSANPTRQFKALVAVGFWRVVLYRSGWPVPTPMPQTRREPRRLLSTRKRMAITTCGFWDIRVFSITCRCGGARPYDWSHPQTKAGDFLAIPYSKVWPEDVTSQFRGSRENIDLPMQAMRAQLRPRSAQGSIIPTGRYCHMHSARFRRRSTRSSELAQ